MMRNTFVILVPCIILGLFSCHQKQTKSNAFQTDSITISAGNNYEDSLYRSKQSSFKIFYLYDFDTVSNTGFITLSEIDNLSQNEDSFAVPLKYLGNRSLKGAEYFKLDSAYRKRFLKRTGLNEADSVFVYDYAKDILLRFEIKKLDVVSHINGYAIDGDSIMQESYMIGLEIKPEFLKGFEEYFSHTFVHIGNENPFVRGMMRPIVWKEATAQVFPTNLKLPDYASYYSNYKPGKSYTFETDSFEFFVREMIVGNEVEGYHIAVYNRKTNDIVFNEASFNSEGSSFKPLNNINPNLEGIYQWTGKLFKEKPDVIFGFGWESFGCESINFLDASEQRIVVLCDNRH